MHERIDKEVQTLSRLSNNDGVPKVLFSNENSFVMEPVCDKIDYYEKNNLDRIIDTLQQAHSKGILHRDLRKCNILKDRDSRTIRVVDWGYAVDVHTSQPFAGGLDCASDLALKSVIERRSIVYQKSDDLVSLLRSFYLTLHGRNGLDTFAFGNKDFQGHAEKTMAFWKSHGQSELWQELFQLAESCDYQGLKNKIAELY